MATSTSPETYQAPRADPVEAAASPDPGPPLAEPARHPPELIIKASGRWPRLNLRELWAYRTLFLFLVLRDVKVRYAQSVLGAGWAVLQPVLAMVVFSLIFGRFAKMPSGGVPYPVFSLAALVPWTYFSTSLTGSSNSLVASPDLITKVYFPRLVLPLAPVLAGLLDFGIAFVVLILFMLAYGIVPPLAGLAMVPLFLLLVSLTSAGAGCWLAAINIQYRDVKYITPFLLQIWLYASPVVYPMSIVPAGHRTWYALNPLVGAVEGLRAILLGTGPIPWQVVGTSACVAALLFVTGALYFRRTERIFADVA